MTINTVSINASHLARVAEAVSSLNQLPAVAAPGWCEAAAKIVASLQPGSIGVVRVARFDPSGEAVEHVASGGWNSTTNSSAPAEKLAPDLESGSAWLMAQSADLATRPRYSRVRELAQGARWAGSRPGREWLAAGATDVGVSVAPLTGHASEYTLCVELGAPSQGAGFDGAEMELLKVVIPELAKRASIAFSAAGMGHGERLTARELEVLAMLAQGKTVKQIAEIIGRSPHTVHDHVKSLHRKLNASSRGELVARALGHPTEEAGSNTSPDRPGASGFHSRNGTHEGGASQMKMPPAGSPIRRALAS